MSDHNAPERVFRYSDILRGVPDDESIKALEERNHARRQAAIAALGHRWLGYCCRRDVGRHLETA